MVCSCSGVTAEFPGPATWLWTAVVLPDYSRGTGSRSEVNSSTTADLLRTQACHSSLDISFIYEEDDCSPFCLTSRISCEVKMVYKWGWW